MYKFIFTYILFFYSHFLFSQKIGIGFKSGLVLSSYNVSLYNDVNEDRSECVDIFLGASLEYNLSKRWAILLDGLYEENSPRFTINPDKSFFTITNKINYQFLQVPVLARYYFSKKNGFNIKLGISNTILLGSTITTSLKSNDSSGATIGIIGNSEQNYNNYTKSYTYSIIGGFGYDKMIASNFKFGIELQYRHNFNNLSNAFGIENDVVILSKALNGCIFIKYLI